MSRRRGFTFAILVAGMILATSAEGVMGPTRPLSTTVIARTQRSGGSAQTAHLERTATRDSGSAAGVRNTTAAHQTISDQLAGAGPKDAEYVYQLKIRNPGAPQRFTIAVSGTGTWPVSYFVHGRDVTTAVASGVFRTPVVGRGETFTVRIEARLGRPGSSITRLIRVASVAHPLRATPSV